MKPLNAILAGILFYPGMLAQVGAATPTPNVTSSVALLEPRTNSYEGVVLERCVGDTGTLRVILAAPKLLQPQNSLLVQVGGIYTPAIRAEAGNDMPSIAAFEGSSAIGCVAPGNKVVLVLNVGGLLNQLDIVIGSGEMRAEEFQ
jgi:hypothetical protein